VVVALEYVLRVPERLDLAQALPGIGIEERARVRRLLDEVRVVAGAVRRNRVEDGSDLRLDGRLRRPTSRRATGR
jgi:hypothetical protein